MTYIWIYLAIGFIWTVILIEHFVRAAFKFKDSFCYYVVAAMFVVNVVFWPLSIYYNLPYLLTELFYLDEE